MTSTTDLIERLSTHKLLAAAPRPELEWMAAHGRLRYLEAGEVLSSKSEPVQGLFLVLSGRIAIFVDRGAGRHKILEWRAGDVAGLLPYSRMINPPGDSIAQEPSEVFAVPRAHLRDVARECHEITSTLVHTMIDRSRVFTSSDLHDEKMVSLGKLSAGLAHELNNPASAIERDARLLESRLDEAERATRAIDSARLTEVQLAAVDDIRRACAAMPAAAVRSPVQQAEREEAIADWLAVHGLDVALADSLAETAVTIDALDAVSRSVEAGALDAVLRWVAAGCAVRSLAAEIREASTRISVLVAAIKGFTHMDRATVAEPIAIGQGLNSTVAVLRSKARHKAAALTIDLEAGLPYVRGYAGELNQIWANLIDNALDAIPTGGRVEVRGSRELERVVVRIADNGGGIPREIRDQIFDPFFTTKPVGQGTGLGLDIVRRLVRHNDGEIAFESEPGRTEFRVSLPLAAREEPGSTP